MGTLILNGNRGKMIMNGVVYGNDIEAGGPNLADIFNHGDVVGLNPYYWDMKSNYSYGTIFDIERTDYIEIAYDSWSYSPAMILTLPIDHTKWKKVCFDVEVPGTQHGTYCDAVIGARSYSRRKTITQTQYETIIPNPAIYLVSWYDQRNYDGTSPWYQLGRQVVKVPVNLSEDYMVSLYTNECYWKIYSIWLEE